MCERVCGPKEILSERYAYKVVRTLPKPGCCHSEGPYYETFFDPSTGWAEPVKPEFVQNERDPFGSKYSWRGYHVFDLQEEAIDWARTHLYPDRSPLLGNVLHRVIRVEIRGEAYPLMIGLGHPSNGWLVETWRPAIPKKGTNS